MKKHWILILAVGLVLISNPTRAQNTDFSVVGERIWDGYLKISPLTASRFGVDYGAGQLPDLSIQALQNKEKKLTSWIKELNNIDTGALSEQDKINRVILLHRLMGELSSLQYRDYLMPLTSEGGFHSSLAFLPRQVEFKTAKDVEDYLSRLSGFTRYFEQQINWMREGIKVGFTQPKVVLKGYEQSIKALIADDPTQSVFYQPFLASMNHFDKAEVAQYKNKAQTIINDVVNPAYEQYLAFMVDEYQPNARDTIAIKFVPKGKDYYQDRANYYTTTNMTAKEIHELGLTEVKRIRAEMKEIIHQVGFEGTFEQFLKYLRTDPKFYAKSGEELLKEASFIAKKMDAALPKLFKYLPRTPYGIQAVPAHIAPKYTTGRYVSPSNDKEPGYYWVNTYALDRRPLYELEALTLHEAVPGHHLQISLNKELEDVPDYRSSYYISAFGEGWGLYAEWLGLEAGFYTDPYSNFGRLTYEMWRATRLVVDTGMHMMGWTRQQAIDYMMENSALSKHNITTEVDRYISWPGQALSYKIGEIKIKQLRQLAESALGNNFDVREFHHQVLKNGAVPLAQLEQQVIAYINRQTARN